MLTQPVRAVPNFRSCLASVVASSAPPFIYPAVRRGAMPAAQPMTPTPEQPIDVKRVLMDRARRHAERDGLPSDRPVLPRLLGFLLAVMVMGVLLLAFDRFLASMQRFLALPIVDPEPPAAGPAPVPQSVPAYVVPVDPQVPADAEVTELPPAG